MITLSGFRLKLWEIFPLAKFSEVKFSPWKLLFVPRVENWLLNVMSRHWRSFPHLEMKCLAVEAAKPGINFKIWTLPWKPVFHYKLQICNSSNFSSPPMYEIPCILRNRVHSYKYGLIKTFQRSILSANSIQLVTLIPVSLGSILTLSSHIQGCAFLYRLHSNKDSPVNCILN